MKTRLVGVNKENAMVVVKVLIENGFTVKVYKTDDTIAEILIEFWQKDEGWQE